MNVVKEKMTQRPRPGKLKFSAVPLDVETFTRYPLCMSVSRWVPDDALVYCSCDTPCEKADTSARDEEWGLMVKISCAGATKPPKGVAQHLVTSRSLASVRGCVRVREGRLETTLTFYQTPTDDIKLAADLYQRGNKIAESRPMPLYFHNDRHEDVSGVVERLMMDGKQDDHERLYLKHAQPELPLSRLFLLINTDLFDVSALKEGERVKVHYDTATGIVMKML